MQNAKDKKILSFIDTLTRNVFLFAVMCIFIALGIAVRLLEIDSLDIYWLQIKSSRLDFIFFIGMSACYIPLLFILIERYWVNFFVQLFCSLILFILLVFVFSPPLKIKSYFFNYDVAFSTRAWSGMKGLYIGRGASFSKFTEGDKQNKLFPDGMICPTRYDYYFLSFVFTFYPNLNTEVGDNELEDYCHKKLLEVTAVASLPKVVSL